MKLEKKGKREGEQEEVKIKDRDELFVERKATTKIDVVMFCCCCCWKIHTRLGISWNIVANLLLLYIVKNKKEEEEEEIEREEKSSEQKQRAMIWKNKWGGKASGDEGFEKNEKCLRYTKAGSQFFKFIFWKQKKISYFQ